MSETIRFTGVELDKFARDGKGVTATFSATFTSDVQAKMNWTEIPECLTGADLEGELACISLTITPSERALSKHEIDLDLAQIHSFKTVRREIEGKKGKGHRTELWLKVFTTDMKGARKLEEYMLTAGKSTIRASYEPLAVQSEMPLSPELDTGCRACNSGIPLQANNPKKHESGTKCTAKAVQEELTQ